MTLRVVNWNVQWATPRSERSPVIVCRINQYDPDVICLTETDDRLLDGRPPYSGHIISAEPVDGKHRTKVLLWSRNPWDQVDLVGDPALPPGRFVSGTTETPIGNVTVIGVCIPWHNSRVAGAKGVMRQWEDHSHYLNRLAAILRRQPHRRLVVAGDFNQRFGPRYYPPLWHPVRAALESALGAGGNPGLTVATAAIGSHGNRTIDHIALSVDLAADSLRSIDNRNSDGKPVSDHSGVFASLSAHE